MFDKNPSYVLNLKEDTDVIVRLKVLAEVAPDGATLVTDIKKFQFAVNAQMYRIQTPGFPPAKGSINLNSLRNPVATTHDGKYTSSLSACVSNRVRVSAGQYMVIPSTFNPQQMGKFELIVYTSSPNVEGRRYVP